MLVAFIVLCLSALILIGMAIAILVGKGDSLIAGYNTASSDAQKVYHKPRVRIIVGILLILVALSLPTFGLLLALGYKDLVLIAFPATAFVLITATFSAAHFWAKKKNKQLV